MRSAERCSSFFQDDLKDEIQQDFQVALIKSNDTNCVIFGPKKMVKEALKKIEAFSKQFSQEEDNRRIVARTLPFKDAPNPLYVGKLTLTQKFMLTYEIKSFNCTDREVTFEAPKEKCNKIM